RVSRVLLARASVNALATSSADSFVSTTISRVTCLMPTLISTLPPEYRSGSGADTVPASVPQPIGGSVPCSPTADDLPRNAGRAGRGPAPLGGLRAGPRSAGSGRAARRGRGPGAREVRSAGLLVVGRLADHDPGPGADVDPVVAVELEPRADRDRHLGQWL